MSFSDVPITKVREFWDASPCNIRHSAQAPGTRAYFDEVEARRYFVEPHIPRFADFSRWAGKRVLEIGCGIGTDTVMFARAGAQVTAVDLSPATLTLAEKRMQVFGLEDRVQLYQADVETLSASVPVQPFDLIYSFGVLHHTPHPDVALAEIRKYAVPGTTLKLMMYHRWSWKVLAILARAGFRFDRTEELVARHSEAQTGCPVTYTYTRDSLKDFVEAQGFAVQAMTVEHIFPYSIPDYVKYRYVRAWFFRLMPRPLFRLLEKTLGWHLCVTAQAQ